MPELVLSLTSYRFVTLNNINFGFRKEITCGRTIIGCSDMWTSRVKGFGTFLIPKVATLSKQCSVYRKLQPSRSSVPYTESYDPLRAVFLLSAVSVCQEQADLINWSGFSGSGVGRLSQSGREMSAARYGRGEPDRRP